jgi:hypothetical protein
MPCTDSNVHPPSALKGGGGGGGPPPPFDIQTSTFSDLSTFVGVKPVLKCSAMTVRFIFLSGEPVQGNFDEVSTVTVAREKIATVLALSPERVQLLGPQGQILQDGEDLAPDVDVIQVVMLEECPPKVYPADLQLCQIVGMGNTAEVYRGVFKGNEVAVKQIGCNTSKMGIKERRALDREVSIMGKTDHENLVRVLGVSSFQEPLRIITEFCSGGCCFELLHNSDHINLTWAQQIKMTRDAASAMEYLHMFKPQIIHRELKSVKLLLSKLILNKADVPCVKVSDFGSACVKDMVRDHRHWGKHHQMFGFHWIAPELFAGTCYDEKVDVYSFAIILFEIICRELPFEEEGPYRIAQLTVKGQRPDMEAVPPDCQELLKDVMISCWALYPKKRPAFDIIQKTLMLVDGP